MASARRLIFNAVTFVPGVASLPPVKRHLEKRSTGTPWSDDARYCYSVWLRHLVKAAANGLNTTPATIAELGPGSSLGMGLAALLSGAQRYYAFDVVEHASVESNLKILDDLVALYRSRAAIPDDAEFPLVAPTLDRYDFPHDVLPRSRLDTALDPVRIEAIRDSLRNTNSVDSLISYRVPWWGSDLIEEGSIDMLFSQAALEHVDNLSEVYQVMRRWLSPTGFMSHQIDFTSHGWDDEWNGHWTYSDLAWKFVRGKDSWHINREPESTHLRLLDEASLRVVARQAVPRPSKLSNRQLSRRFRGISDEDLVTSGTFFQAVRQ